MKIQNAISTLPNLQRNYGTVSLSYLQPTQTVFFCDKCVNLLSKPAHIGAKLLATLSVNGREQSTFTLSLPVYHLPVLAKAD